MNTLLLQPTDVLFFRDGRPMGGASAGHGAAWPLPTVTDAALHAALHRSDLKGHRHDQMRNGERAQKDSRQFGSLVTAGPFPVFVGSGSARVSRAASGVSPDAAAETWYFPRPIDLTAATLDSTLRPVSLDGSSSLPAPLRYAAASTVAPSKDSAAKAWLSAIAYERYLAGTDTTPDDDEALDDRDFSDSEATIGIAIDSATGTTGQGDAAGKLYSAHYLRLRDGWRLGCFAKTNEKVNGDPAQRADLIEQLFGEKQHIVVGGQQRVCTTTCGKSSQLPLPPGLHDGFTVHNGKHLVKWVLLSPAVFPNIAENKECGIIRHPGGWLPTWIDARNGVVMLKSGDTDRGEREGREVWRTRVRGMPNISATLVAALVPKPIVVTGWSLGDETFGDEAKPGAKPTHLAVPAGAVYYFAADSADDAHALATALNWHGATPGTAITRRRSTLLGEKGFGLGVCGTWRFLNDICRNGKPVAELRAPSSLAPGKSRLTPDPRLKVTFAPGFDPTEPATEEDWPEDAR